MIWLKAIGKILVAPFILIFGILLMFLAVVYEVGGGDISKHWLGKFVEFK